MYNMKADEYIRAEVSLMYLSSSTFSALVPPAASDLEKQLDYQTSGNGVKREDPERPFAVSSTPRHTTE
jgi:hypothetical protein